MIARIVETETPNEFAVEGPWDGADPTDAYTDGAHVVLVRPDGCREPNRVLATYRCPWQRSFCPHGSWEWENEYRDAIERHVKDWLSDAMPGGCGCTIQYDPGLDSCEEVVLAEPD